MHITIKKYDSLMKNKLLDVTESNYRKNLIECPENDLNIVLIDNTVVGWMELYIPDKKLYSAYIFIYIAPEYRRKGIGSYVYRAAEIKLNHFGGNWWSSYPESSIANNFAISVGFDYTNTNSFMLHNGNTINTSNKGIRSCVKEDYLSVSNIWSREYAKMHARLGIQRKSAERTETDFAEGYSDFCINIDNYFVLESNGVIVGMGSIFEDNSGIGSLAVEHNHSGKGYGTKLATFLTNECIKRGCESPKLYCESGNDNAMHIYKKIGYVEINRESIAVKQ